MSPSCALTTALRQDGRAIRLGINGLGRHGADVSMVLSVPVSADQASDRTTETPRSGFSSILSAFRVNTASSERGVAAERALQRAPCGMSGGRPAVSYRTVVPLDTLCDTYGLADEVIGDPAGAAESGAPA
jgi:hypothetical protein